MSNNYIGRQNQKIVQRSFKDRTKKGWSISPVSKTRTPPQKIQQAVQEETWNDWYDKNDKELEEARKALAERLEKERQEVLRAEFERRAKELAARVQAQREAENAVKDHIRRTLMEIRG